MRSCVEARAYRALIVLVGLGLVGCAERGAAAGSDAGSTTLDCGEHGSAHGEHCHCHQGYLFDGEQCVPPDEIRTLCGTAEHEDDAGACRCPDEGICACEEGEVVSYGEHDYCEPPLHGE